MNIWKKECIDLLPRVFSVIYLTLEEVAMRTRDEIDSADDLELIDLGAVSVETKGDTLIKGPDDVVSQYQRPNGLMAD